MKSCASILAANFKSWGVNHLFGIPGKAISPLIFELEENNIEFILSKHESGGGFQAAGYALMNQKMAVALGTSGPGGTNLLTAAGQAKASNIPLLLITGHPSMRDTGKAMGQDSSMFGTDLVDMFKSVTKFSARVERADMLEGYLQHALEKALSGVKGPVHLSIPFDILIEQIAPFEMELPQMQEMVSPSLDEVRNRLDAAARPLLFLGKGVHSSRAYVEIQQLAESWDVPVITTPGGKGTFITNHKLSLGAFGLGGTAAAAEYVKSGIDEMIVIGTSLSDMSIPGMTPDMYPKHIIHFDYNPTFIGKSIPVPVTPVLGDIRSNLKLLLEDVPKANSSDYLIPVEKGIPEESDPEERISAVTSIQVMRNSLPEDAILFGDDGSHTFYGIKYYDIYRPGSFFFDDIFGAMGHAIGYSIGAKLAAPDETIVCLVGDGCMFMHGTEISTAFNYDSPVLFIVFNNGRLDMVEKGMKKMTGSSIGGIYDTPMDAALFAQSMGLQAFTARNENELADSIRQALDIIEETNKPVLVEVLVRQNEIPPTMGRQ